MVELAGGERTITADRVVAATGYRPDHTIAGELRLDLDPILGSNAVLHSTISTATTLAASTAVAVLAGYAVALAAGGAVVTARREIGTATG